MNLLYAISSMRKVSVARIVVEACVVREAREGTAVRSTRSEGVLVLVAHLSALRATWLVQCRLDHPRDQVIDLSVMKRLVPTVALKPIEPIHRRQTALVGQIQVGI